MQLPVPVAPAELPNVASHLASALEYARNEKSEATRRAYSSDCRHFAAWCSEHQVEPLPASVETTVAYLASLADGGMKASTITRRAAAIRYAHRMAGLEPPTNAEPVKAVLKGIRRAIGVAVTRKAPATARTVTAMLRRIPADTLEGKRDRALLLLGFAAALRRSELVALRVEDLERTPEGVFVHIRRSKTDQEGAGHVVAVPRGSRLKPVEALEAWLAASGIREGLVFPLTDRSVALIIKRRAKAAGFDPETFAGHSLRAGFVTSALEAGADLLKVMDVTRHREVKTLQAYDRRAKAFKAHAGGKFL